MGHPTTGRHRRPCHSMAGRMWALAAALLATALAALFSPGPAHPPRPARPPRRVSRALPAPPATTAGSAARRGDLLANPPGFPEPDMWAFGASTASARWEQAYRGRSAPFESEDRVDDDPDHIAGALVRPYLDRAAVPRPRPAEPEDHPPPAEDEFAELADRIRAYLVLNPEKGGHP